MSYTKLTDFAAKDALLSGNPSKLLRGTEIGAEFAALETADALNAKTGTGVSFSSITDTGNLTFTGMGNRITGDFSNATIANRVMFQTSTVNGNTTLGAIPNGSAATCTVAAYSDIDLTNANFASMQSIEGVAVVFEAGRTGGQAYTPMTFHTGGTERMRIDASGNVTLSSATGGLGYGTGSGGTVTQATSKSTAVTLNKSTGLITMASDALTAGVAVSFLVNNSLYALTDVIALTIVGGYSLASNYRCWANGNNVGSFIISLENRSGASLSNAVQLQFAIIKGAVS